MSAFPFYFTLFLVKLLSESGVSAVPTCIIIDTNTNQRSEEEINNRTSSSLLLRNLRMLDQQRPPTVPEFVVQSIPLSYIDLKQTAAPPLLDLDLDPVAFKKSLAEPLPERVYSPCSIKLLNEIETQMVVPFEFRRLRLEQPDHHSKFLDDDPRETVPDLSTTVYERRSDPDGTRFCRTCQDGLWSELAVCEAIRCDAELLRANPRLVTQWGEIKPADDGSLYAPSTIFAIYAFAFGPHCKRCESNGQWSRYALPELCSEIRFFAHSTTTAETIKKTTATTSTTTTTTTTTMQKKQ